MPPEPRLVGTAVGRVLEAWRRAGGVDRSARFRARVVLGEAIANAVRHGSAGDPARRIRVEGRATPGLLRVSVTDEGEGFDPRAVPDPTEGPRLAAPGGRGLFLIRRLADRALHAAGGRRLTLWVAAVPGPEAERRKDRDPGRDGG